MSAKTRARLREQLLASATMHRSPFTVAELLSGMSTWASSTVDRELRRLDEEGLITLIRSHPQRRYVLGRPAGVAAVDPAPDWDRGYPSGGEQIGPTWQVMWDAMADGAWHDVRELVALGEGERGCATATVRNQLFAAARAHLIEPEARQDELTNRWRIWYRRPDRAVSA